MALVIGPAAPSTLAALVLLSAPGWRALQGVTARRARQGNGAPGQQPERTPTRTVHPALLGGFKPGRESSEKKLQPPPAQGQGVGRTKSPSGWWLLGALYATVLPALAVGSISGVWPFPAPWPETLTARGLQSDWPSRSTDTTTFTLALAAAALARAAAVDFAVHVTQCLPTLGGRADRFASVTTEAATLAAGAPRSLTSAYAGLQFLLPTLAFGIAAWLGRPLRFTVAAS